MDDQKKGKVYNIEMRNDICEGLEQNQIKCRALYKNIKRGKDGSCKLKNEEEEIGEF